MDMAILEEVYERTEGGNCPSLIPRVIFLSF